MESVVKHTPNTYYLELRQDYITLCMSLTYRKEKSKSSPHCKALILAIMEKWTNDKIGKKKDPHISMTYPQWIEEMYGLFGRSVIIDSLDELNHEELIAKESYKSARGGRDQYKYILNYELLNKSLNPTFTNQPCEEEQSVKVDDQGLQINVATSKNKRCSSSPTFKSKRFIESDTQNQNIKSKKESTPSQTSQFTSQEKQIYDNYCLCFNKDMPRAPLPNATEKLIRDIVALAAGINTQEEMQSLFAYAKARIRGDNPRVYPANLLYWIDAWKVEWQAQTFALPGPTETPEPAQAVYREHASLPMDMQMWMIDTVKEFGATDLEAECVQGLEWCYQHTTCSEDAFYEKMLQAYATCVKERKDLLFCLCQELGIDSNSNSKQMLTTAS